MSLHRFLYLLGFISSLVACLQLNIALLNSQAGYTRRRHNLTLLLSISSKKTWLKRVKKSPRPRRFWVTPGRTSAWRNNLVDQVVIPEEWRKNFRMSRDSLPEFANELGPYVKDKDTIMRSPVDLVKQVACTLYYLSDEGLIRKTANACGISCQVVSEIVRRDCKAITVHLGPKKQKLRILSKSSISAMGSPTVWEPMMALTLASGNHWPTHVII